MGESKRIPITEEEFRDSVKGCPCCDSRCDNDWYLDTRSVLLDLFFEIQDLRSEIALIKGEK